MHESNTFSPHEPEFTDRRSERTDDLQSSAEQQQGQETETAVTSLAQRVVDAYMYQDDPELQAYIDDPRAFSHAGQITDLLAQTVGGRTDSENYYLPEYLKGAKVFCNTVFDILSEKANSPERAKVAAASKQLAWHLTDSTNSVFESLPFGDGLELLEKSRQTAETEALSQHLTPILEYAGAFYMRGDNDSFLPLLNQPDLTPTQKVLRIRALSQVIRGSHNYDSAELAGQKMARALEQITGDPEQPALVGLAAETALIEHRLVMADEYGSTPDSADLQALEHLREAHSQRYVLPSLHATNPTMEPQVDHTRQIAVAKDAVGVEYNGRLQVVAKTRDLTAGDITHSVRITWQSLREIGKDKHIAQGAAELLQTIHDPVTREFLEERLGCSLDAISLESQLYLADYLSTAHRDKFNRFTQTTSRLPETQRSSFLGAYLSLEHGDEFGDTLVNLADRLETDQLDRLLDGMDLLRQSSATFEQLFGSIEPEFARQASQAVIRRATEMLSVLEKVTIDGKAERQLERGRVIAADDADEIIDTFYHLGMALGSLHLDTSGELSSNGAPVQRWQSRELAPGLTSIESHFDPGHGEFTMPFLGQTGIMLRAHGVPFEQRDTAHEYDGQARINFLIADPFESAGVSLEVADPARSRALSIRLDRESPDYDEQGRPIFGTDQPTRTTGQVSLDIGSIFDTEDNPNFMIGKLLALGNILLSEKRGVHAHLNHIRETFDPRFGDREVFASIVQRLEQSLTHSAQDHSGSPVSALAS